MKLLYVSNPGADYSVISFENCFRGNKITELIEDLSSAKLTWQKYIEKEDGYTPDLEDLKLEVREINISEEDFKWIHGCIGDYDGDKHAKIFLETETIH